MTKTVCQRPRFMGKAAEQGIALLTVIFALLLITVLGLALTAIGIRAVAITTNERQSTEVLYIADSGITHAKGVILPLSQAGVEFDTFLTAGDGNSCTGDELSNLNALGVAPLPAPLVAGDAIPTAGVIFPPGGRYMISVCDDDESTDNPPDLDLNDDTNGRIRVISTGLGRNNSTATIEIIIAAIPLPAILVNGNLRISGNPEITGAAGAIHSNGTLDLDGTPCVDQFISSSGPIIDGNQGDTCPKNSGVPAELHPGSDPIAVPTLNPADFIPDADYIMTTDPATDTCAVFDSAGNPLNNPVDKKWVLGGGAEWNCDPAARIWTFSGGNDPLPGTHYSDGNFVISGSPGTPATPVSLTLIAEGWVDISGNPEMIPALTQGATDYSVIAGTDLKIGGNPANAYTGVFYARDQIDFSGNPTLDAQVIAADQSDLPFPNPAGINLVQLGAGGFMVISGNPTINFDGGAGLVSTSDVGWRECRGPNPAAPCT